jgi:hypothetical protein
MFSNSKANYSTMNQADQNHDDIDYTCGGIMKTTDSRSGSSNTPTSSRVSEWRVPGNHPSSSWSTNGAASSRDQERIGYSIVWILVLFFISWPLAGAIVPIWIFILPLESLLPPCKYFMFFSP